MTSTCPNDETDPAEGPYNISASNYLNFILKIHMRF